MSSPEAAGHGSGVAATEPAAQPAAAAETAAADTSLADLSELETLAGRPLAEHAEVYQRVHEQLQAALARLDGS